jgi:phospholipid transport system substrate-binding protein
MQKMHQSIWFTIAIFALFGSQHMNASVAGAVEQSNSRAPAVEASASDATSVSPQDSIERFHAGLLDIMKHAKQLGLQGRIEKLGPLMNQTFDLDFMASKTVGRHWKKLSPEDQQRWNATFSRFTVANYAGRFTGFTGEVFKTIGVDDAPRETKVVLTKIIIPDEDDVELNYRMIDRDGSWKVIDVFLNGTVSELALRRSEYSSELKRSGFEQLVELVEAKILDLEKEDLAGS